MRFNAVQHGQCANVSRGIERLSRTRVADYFGAMQDTTSNSFARRARLSTASITIAIAVTIAAVAALLRHTPGSDMADLKIDSPATAIDSPSKR